MNTHTIAHTTSLAPLGLHPLKKTHRLGRWVSFFSSTFWGTDQNRWFPFRDSFNIPALGERNGSYS